MAVLGIANDNASSQYPKIVIENNKCSIVVFSVPNGVQMQEKAVVTDPPEEAQCWRWLGDLDHVKECDSKTMIPESRISEYAYKNREETIWWWGHLVNMVHEEWANSSQEQPLGANIIYVKYK